MSTGIQAMQTLLLCRRSAARTLAHSGSVRVIVLLMALLTSGCANDVTGATERTPVSLTTAGSVFAPATMVEASLKNEGALTLGSGACITGIETLRSGRWRSYDPGPRGCFLIFLRTAPGTSQRFFFELPATAPAGIYRLLLDVQPVTDTSLLATDIVRSNPFQITAR